MHLRSTKKHWERFARTDPFWAVLTDGERKGNRWTEEDFFRTGVDSVRDELAGVREACPDLRLGSALDFGCGVGRLTQALAEHFQHVTGVDISDEMLTHARRFNRHGERVRYLLNTSDNLRQLADNSFDFVYSVITLQHMEPVFARRYIAEFVRVAAPGGVILFQIPSVSVRHTPRPFTLWPDTLLKRLYRDLRRKLAADPIMEMHGIPRAEIEALLAASGARLIRSYRYDAAGTTIESWGYLARKL
ncbi:MAG: methyltransferase domain-containing protein [Opitutae bacterium]|nr:methyltransferase domain-containing protein [Opitutae bacterium]